MPTNLPKVAAVMRRKAAAADAADARAPVTLDRTIAHGRQDVDYIEHLSIDGRKARITIRSNAYSFQSSARLDVLDREAMKWNLIVALPAAAMKTPEGLCYEPAERDLQRHFDADRAQLLATLAGLMS
jgi:hypothetical protein